MSQATVLALDLATKTGFAVGDPHQYPRDLLLSNATANGYRPTSGVKQVAPYGTPLAEFLSKYIDWYDDMLKVHDPKWVVFEAPLPVRQQGEKAELTARKLLGLAAMTEAIAYRRGVKNIREVTVLDVRKHVLLTNPRRKDAKRAVFELFKRRGFDPADDNESDALAVFDLAAHSITGGR